ncbi:hypothetical protein QJS04_geneDACA017278 [Acorus gramineus]|uniref:Uncharacterized protein n=1 Tax=Acorus gramineus TaxID=55184 RepID=A0AAV9A2Q8_ACOGR|nr:hypothetical protein QJS04_geneDACA017278 [Acorus gramineus]
MTKGHKHTTISGRSNKQSGQTLDQTRVNGGIAPVRLESKARSPHRRDIRNLRKYSFT